MTHGSVRSSLKNAGLAVWVLALVISAEVARADTIILTNRVTYSGAIVSETADAVTIQSDGLQWTFKKDQVASIARDRKVADKELSKDRKRHAEAEKKAAQATKGQVIVYGTSWCGWCKRARAFFRERHIPFVDKDVEADPMAASELHRKCEAAGVSANGVPVIDVYGTMVNGFDQRRIESVLASRR